MSVTGLMEKLSALPKEKQEEIFDFLDHMVDGFAGHNDSAADETAFAEFSLRQALRGMETIRLPTPAPISGNRSDAWQAERAVEISISRETAVSGAQAFQYSLFRIPKSRERAIPPSLVML